jgi:tetratricopeptide (TPR) repeat protein
LKRRQALARLTSSITWKNVVFLFEPEPFDLVAPLSCYYNHWDELVEEPSFLLDDVPGVLLLPIEAPVPRAGDQFNLKTYHDLDELCSLSWQEFGPTGRPPEQWLESIAGEEGPILARKIQDRHEEVTLLQDRVRILFGLHEDQKALEMARESLRCARSFYDDLAETASLGLITIAMMRLGDLPQAREAAEDALQLACDLGDPHQQAEFLMDLGRISDLEEQPAHAVDAFLKAIQLYREQGNGEKAIIATKFLFDAYVQMGSWNQAVLQLEQLAKDMDGMSDNLRTPTTDFITTSLKRIATEAPVADAAL